MHVLGRSQKSLLETMELLHLPSTPHVLGFLLDRCYDPTATIEDLASIIALDTAFSSKVLMAANSTTFPSKKSALSLKQIVSLLGREHIKTLVITSAIKQLFSGYSQSRFQFIGRNWLDSIYSALFSKAIAQTINYPQVEDAYIAGLLHDFGQIVFDSKFHKQYIAVIDSETEDETLHKEIHEFGIDHADLGANIIEQWSNLHPSIADAVRFHHQQKEQLRGSDILCQIIAESSSLASHWSVHGEPDKKWKSTFLTEVQTEQLYKTVRQKISTIAVSLKIPTAEDISLNKSLLNKNIEQNNILLAQKIRDKSLIKALDSVTTGASPSISPRKLLIKITEEMQILFSFRDVVMLFPDNQEKGLLILHELKQAKPVTGFTIDGNKSEIVKCFRKGKILWIDPDNTKDEKLAISDQQIIRRTRHDLALTLPLISSKGVIGTVVIGCNKVQQNFLKSQSSLIANYLNNVAEMWCQNKQSYSLDSTANETILIRQLIHEISNPLSVIGNYIDIIKRKSNSDDSSESKEIDILKEELLRVKTIITNFGNNAVTNSQSLYLNNELKNCIPLYVKSISNKIPVNIIWNLDEVDAVINITRDALRQIILNLITNAVEAQSKIIEIMVSTHHFVNTNGNSYAQFSISDKGKGIQENIQPLLFSPLKSTKQGEVRGIGLSIVADFLERYNGQIKYIENQFGGATFEVLLPLDNNLQSGE